MDPQEQEIIGEFLVESQENLARIELDLVALEQQPHDAELLARIFRAMHTIKGTAGFLAFSTIEAISHHVETLLSHLRDGEGVLSPALVALLHEAVDAIRQLLASIEAHGEEGPDPITTDLHRSLLQTLRQPIGTVWNRFPRLVRDLSAALGKQIRLDMHGEATELDRTILEAIKDPLLHLVRNACDHGMEAPEVRARAGKPREGTITLRAAHAGGQVRIEVSDDGAGIDLARIKENAIEKRFLSCEHAATLTDGEALRLIFLPGFSTAPTVTRLSGRGVGMDVVKSRIENIGGVVDLLSKPGAGLTVQIRIPSP